MINIREDTCINIPGTSSLHITFNYNQEIISIIKSCHNYYFNKKLSEWEVDVNSLSYLIDNLIYLDDIQLDIAQVNKHTSNLLPTLNYKTAPYPYQLEGIKYGLQHSKYLLLDEAGLGKTLQIIYLAEELKAQEGLEHCLIVCGLNVLKTNWKREIERHSNLDCMILGEYVNSKGNISYKGIKDRALQLTNEIKEFFIITNIESLRSDEIIKAFKKGKNKIGMIAVDEVHKCKSPTSIQSKGLLKLDASHKIAMTGTLIVKNPLDAYMPLKWIGEEHTTFTNFKTYYCNFDYSHQIIGYKNLDTLKDQLQECSLRRTKDLLDLPPKNIIKEYVDMEDNHRKFYDDINSSIFTSDKTKLENVDLVKLNTSQLLSMIVRLRQATSCPSVLSSNTDIKPSKILRAIDLIEQITSSGEKVVVFSSFKEVINIMQTMCKDYSPLILTGDSTEQECLDAQVKFQNDDKYKLLLGTWQKAGTGLTLTKASYMIFIDTPWDEALFSQACDRIYRIGTTKSVFIYSLICPNTIDERVAQLILQKGALSKYIIDDKVDANSREILLSLLN